jgi:hypothetical protein
MSAFIVTGKGLRKTLGRGAWCEGVEKGRAEIEKRR